MEGRQEAITVMIVDDSQYMRRVLRRICETQGWQVVGEADNGLTAIDLVETLQPRVVTLDITMPVLNGLASLPRILAARPEACVVMVTAVGQQDKLVEAVRAGARGFIAKPFSPERVCEAIQDALRLSASALRDPF